MLGIKSALFCTPSTCMTVATHDSNVIVKFAGETSVVGLISNNRPFDTDIPQIAVKKIPQSSGFDNNNSR